jgi:hypothetical protein
MRNSFRIKALLVLGVLSVSLTLPLRAATTIFDNSVNDLSTQFNPGFIQVGDQIILGGTDRYLTYFDFEYWGTASSSSWAGTVEARVRFYLNDGPLFNSYATPGTMFFDSGYFGGFGPINADPFRATLTFTAGAEPNWPSGGLHIPGDANEMTWSVQFRGMEGSDSVGLDIYSPPVVGAEYPDYWSNDGTGWMLLTNSVSAHMDFAARMEAVPEPSVATLSVLGGLGILGLAYRLRRKK